MVAVGLGIYLCPGFPATHVFSPPRGWAARLLQVEQDGLEPLENNADAKRGAKADEPPGRNRWV